MTPCGLVSSYQCFGGACCIHLSGSSKKRQHFSNYQLLLTQLYSIISRRLWIIINTTVWISNLALWNLSCSISVLSKLINLLQNYIWGKLCLQNRKLLDIVYLTKKVWVSFQIWYSSSACLLCVWLWFFSPTSCLPLLSPPWCQTLQLVNWASASETSFSPLS
jgi:hypothetical protein